MKEYYVYKPNNSTNSNSFVTLLFSQGSTFRHYSKFIEGHIYVSEFGYINSEYPYPTRFVGRICEDFEKIEISEEVLMEIKTLKSSKKKHDLVIDIVPKYIGNNGEIIYRCTPIKFSGLYKKINFFKLMSVGCGEGKTPTDALISFNNKLRKIILSCLLAK